MSCTKDLVDIAAVLDLPLSTVILPEGLLYILHKDIYGKEFGNFISKDVWNNTILKSIADRLELGLQIGACIDFDDNHIISLGDVSTLKYPDGTTLYCTIRESEFGVYYGIWVTDIKNYGFPPTLREDIIPKAGFKEIDIYNDISSIGLKLVGYPFELLNKSFVKNCVTKITSGYILRKK